MKYKFELSLVALMPISMMFGWYTGELITSRMSAEYKQVVYNTAIERKTPQKGLEYATEYNYVKHTPYTVQLTGAVQKTQSASMLHELSVGIEITPLEMLRNGVL
jgi:hypothetical protein